MVSFIKDIIHGWTGTSPLSNESQCFETPSSSCSRAKTRLSLEFEFSETRRHFPSPDCPLPRLSEPRQVYLGRIVDIHLTLQLRWLTIPPIIQYPFYANTSTSVLNSIHLTVSYSCTFPSRRLAWCGDKTSVSKAKGGLLPSFHEIDLWSLNLYHYLERHFLHLCTTFQIATDICIFYGYLTVCIYQEIWLSLEARGDGAFVFMHAYDVFQTQADSIMFRYPCCTSIETITFSQAITGTIHSFINLILDYNYLKILASSTSQSI